MAELTYPAAWYDPRWRAAISQSTGAGALRPEDVSNYIMSGRMGEIQAAYQGEQDRKRTAIQERGVAVSEAAQRAQEAQFGKTFSLNELNAQRNWEIQQRQLGLSEEQIENQKKAGMMQVVGQAAGLFAKPLAKAGWEAVKGIGTQASATASQAASNAAAFNAGYGSEIGAAGAFGGEGAGALGSAIGTYGGPAAFAVGSGLFVNQMLADRRKSENMSQDYVLGMSDKERQQYLEYGPNRDQRWAEALSETGGLSESDLLYDINKVGNIPGYEPYKETPAIPEWLRGDMYYGGPTEIASIKERTENLLDEANWEQDYQTTLGFYKDISGGTVLCTELHRQGKLADDIYRADSIYGKSIDPEILLGYHAWAVPLARLMARSDTVTTIMSPFIKAWAKEAAHRMGVVDSGSLFGRCISYVGMPACKAIGRAILLYKSRLWEVI